MDEMARVDLDQFPQVPVEEAEEADHVQLMNELRDLANANLGNDNETAQNATRRFIQNLTIEELDALMMDGSEHPGARLLYRLRRDIEMIYHTENILEDEVDAYTNALERNHINCERNHTNCS